MAREQSEGHVNSWRCLQMFDQVHNITPLSGVSQQVWFALYRKCNSISWKSTFYMKLETLQAMANITRNPVRAAITDLLDKGLITHIPGTHKGHASEFGLCEFKEVSTSPQTDNQRGENITPLKSTEAQRGEYRGEQLTPIDNQRGEQRGEQLTPSNTNTSQCIKETNTTKSESEEKALTHSPDILIAFSELNTWMKTNAPDVLKMVEPLTIDQYVSLQKEFPNKHIELKQVLQAMHNTPDLVKIKKSAFVTVSKWLPNERIQVAKNNENSDSRAEEFKSLLKKANSDSALRYQEEQNRLLERRRKKLDESERWNNVPIQCSNCGHIYNASGSKTCPRCGTVKIVLK
jgi:predicted Zn-ribbon and HTH transcriptional regulator